MTKNTKKPLTPQEELYCQAYANPESETYGNGSKSAAKAEYKEPHNAAWKLKRRPHVQARLAEMYRENESSIGRVMSDLRSLQLRAEAKGDLSSAVAALKLQGMRFALFSERMVNFDDKQQRQLTEQEVAQAKMIAHYMNSHKAEDVEDEQDALDDEREAEAS